MPRTGRTCANAFFDLPAAKRPTAIFAGSDYMAYGAIAAAEQRGLRVPEDMAAGGFDDKTTSPPLETALTTLPQPVSENGLPSTGNLPSPRGAAHPADGLFPTVRVP